MNLVDKIEAAFGHRVIPKQVVSLRGIITSEQRDALWFSGRDWRSLSERDWHDHGDAIFALTSEAFVFYLASILSLTSGGRCQLAPADAIIQCLDRSPNPAYRDDFLTTRFICLKDKECQVLKEWLLSLAGHTYVDAENASARAYETIDLLQRETARLRKENLT